MSAPVTLLDKLDAIANLKRGDSESHLEWLKWLPENDWGAVISQVAREAAVEIRRLESMVSPTENDAEDRKRIRAIIADPESCEIFGPGLIEGCTAAIDRFDKTGEWLTPWAPKRH